MVAGCGRIRCRRATTCSPSTSSTRRTAGPWAVSGAHPSWLAPSWGAIMRTRDGGATWGSECCLDEALRAVCFLDTRRGWAVGDVVMMTTDGGTTWVQSPSPVSSLQAVDFVDADNGWAVGGGDGPTSGNFRTIVHSGDGGATWQQQYYYSDSGHDGASLHAVDFVSTTIGWAVGEGGLILHTTDGGASGSSSTPSDVTMRRCTPSTSSARPPAGPSAKAAHPAHRRRRRDLDRAGCGHRREPLSRRLHRCDDAVGRSATGS